MKIALLAELVLMNALLRPSLRAIYIKSILIYALIAVHVPMSARSRQFILKNKCCNHKNYSGLSYNSPVFLFGIVFCFLKKPL